MKTDKQKGRTLNENGQIYQLTYFDEIWSPERK